MFLTAILSVALLSPLITAQLYDSCHDSDINCSFWQKYGECLKNPKYMWTACRLSCGICFQAPGAGDGSINGRRFGFRVENLGKSPYTPGTFGGPAGGAATTPLTTGGSSAAAATTATTAASGDTTPTTVAADATTTTTAGECKDYLKLCQFWTQYGECAHNPSFMLVYCAKSCQSCASQSTSTIASTPSSVSPSTETSSTPLSNSGDTTTTAA